MSAPLADKIRPQTLDDIVGQTHLLGEGKVLRKIIDSKNIHNMIFYGPSGVGKTTLAGIIAAKTNKKLFKLNGTSTSTAQIKEIIAQTGTLMTNNGILLYLDEIQYLNKKQQQSLLEHIENGDITLIASTTENPYFYIYNAILSRSTVFEFKPVSPDEIIKAIKRGFTLMQEELNTNFELETGVCEHIAKTCGGDVRKSLNTVELCSLSAEYIDESKSLVTLQTTKELSQKSNMRYDRDSDEHYNILSAFQKSIRGSDENAALHYLARLIEAGDLISPCRRLLVIASEDIGLAYPQAISIVKACVDSATQLGYPEARIPLAQAVVLLCTAPKSNSAICAIDAALSDVQSQNFGDIPMHLKDGHYEGAQKLGNAIGYLYPHAYENHYVKQQYLPNEIKNKVYYEFGQNKSEQTALQYRKKIKED